MKQQISPTVAIVVGVVVIGLLCLVLYKWAFTPKGAVNAPPPKYTGSTAGFSPGSTAGSPTTGGAPGGGPTTPAGAPPITTGGAPMTGGAPPMTGGAPPLTGGAGPG